MNEADYRALRAGLQLTPEERLAIEEEWPASPDDEHSIPDRIGALELRVERLEQQSAPVEYPRGYWHRRYCSRTHPVPWPCDQARKPAAALSPERA